MKGCCRIIGMFALSLFSCCIYANSNINQMKLKRECSKTIDQTSNLQIYKKQCGIEFLDDVESAQIDNTNYCRKIFGRTDMVKYEIEGRDSAISKFQTLGKTQACEEFINNFSDLIK